MRRRLLLLGGACAAAAAASLTASFPLGTVQLDAFGSGIRVRVAPPGAPIVDAPIRALLPAAPAASLPASASGSVLTVGDLVATLDTNGLVSFSRASNGAVLLAGTSVHWAAARNATQPG